MKKTQVIELVTNIKKTKISFISILMFIFLGTSIFLALGWVGKSLNDALDRYFVMGNMHDIEVYYPYGISDKQISEVAKIDNVDEVEGYYYGYEYFYLNDEKKQAKIVSINSKIDYPFEIEGRLPQSQNEIVVEKGSNEKLGLNIGDTITFYGQDSKSSYLLSILKNEQEEQLQDDLIAYEEKDTSYLVTDTFIVVGVAIDCEYISKSGSSYGQSSATNTQVNAIFLVNEDSFNHDVIDEYNALLIRSDYLRNLSTFSDEYKEKSLELKKQIQSCIDDINQESFNDAYQGYQDLLTYTQTELDDGKKKIDDGYLEIEKSEKKLKEAKTQLNQAKKEIEDGEKELAEGKETLESYENELNAKINQLNKVKNSINELENSFAEKLEDYDSSIVITKWESFVSVLESSGLEDKINEEYSEELIDEAYGYLKNFATDFLASLTSEEDYAIYEEQINTILSSDVSIKEKFKQLAENIETIYQDIITKTGDVFYTVLLNDLNGLKNKVFEKMDSLISPYQSAINNAWQEYYDNEKLLEEGKAEYQKGLKEYNNGVKKLEQAKVDLSDGEKEYQEGLENFEILKSKEELLENTETIVLTRESSAAVMFTDMLAEIMSKIKYSLGGLFLVISLMVCYSVVTRIVNDQIIQIGTKKALGLMKKEITLSYLAYTGLTVIIGGLCGLALSLLVIEPILAPNVTGTFTFSVNPHYFEIKDFLILFFGQLALIELITYAGCSNILNKNAIKLLQGNDVALGKQRLYEKLPLWNHLSLLVKTIINNCFNDSRRIIATIIGVAGCTALIVCAITFKNNVLAGFTSEFTDYFHFDSFVYFDSTIEGASENISNTLDRLQVKNTPIYRQFVYTSKEDEFEDIFTYIMVYDQDDPAFMELIDFNSYQKGNKFENGETWIADSICDYYNLKINDELTWTDIKGKQTKLNMDGYFDFYYYNSMAFLSNKTYEEKFGKEYQPNIYIIDTDNTDVEALKAELMKIDGFTTLFDFEAYIGEDAAVFTSIADVIVYLYTGVSVLMAIFVLLNLLVTFVEEKKKELIVLMINGFSLKQARAYIYSDTILLTFVGILIGVGVGSFAGNYCIKAFEGKYLYLVHALDLSSCIIGSVITIVLTFIMTVIALRRIKTFKLTDINK